MTVRQCVIFLIASWSSFTAIADSLERRMAIEISSSAIKYAIADVNRETDIIVNYQDVGVFAAPLHSDLLNSPDRQFSNDIRKKVIKIFMTMKSKSDYYHVSKIRAIATEVFRESRNAGNLAVSILGRTGINIKTVSPLEEDRLDFFTAIRTSGQINHPVVWDIGAVSSQLIIEDNNQEPFTHKSETGSLTFIQYLLEVVKYNDKTPSKDLHPLSSAQAQSGITYARYLARQTPGAIKDAIKINQGHISTIGSLFKYSISEDIAQGNNSVSKEILQQHINRWIRSEERNLHQSTDDPAKLGFSHANLANAILVLGFMIELGINTLDVVDSSTTDSILEYTPLWQ